ncbi:hypothetical protein WA026_008828 [Henosepilachna vigintioctopunctata]|uniref:PiggyBac transposable element-derived protein domain-containing protein n=1 Tax=Henosepilachna vigintioctopunctata TaxID=420089 RepID=A0AAW1V2V7_9CUCU
MGINATIDEMMIGFRGCSHLIIYMPRKPVKYGLKVQANSDSKTFYFYDGNIYSGKGSGCVGLTEEENKLQVPTCTVVIDILLQPRFLYKHLPRELHAPINRVLREDASEDVREENQVAEGNQSKNSVTFALQN